MRRTWFDILWEIPDKITYWGLPRGCWHCEVLGLCRLPKNQGWKCHGGCLILDQEKERKYQGLPRGCWDCAYLSQCRRPKEEDWRCYNGCRKIKERRGYRGKGSPVCKNSFPEKKKGHPADVLFLFVCVAQPRLLSFSVIALFL